MTNKDSEILFEGNEAIAAYLKDSRLFNHLPDKELEKLVPLSEIATVSEGTELLVEGQENDKVFFLLRGKLGIYADNKPIIELKRKGDIVGEGNIISNKPCNVTVKAISSVSYFSIRAKNIGQYIDIDSEHLQHILYRIFAMVMSDKLSLTTFKAKKYEQEHQRMEEAQKNLQHAYTLLDEHARQLEEAKRKAEIANISKSEFLANISHELRDPMNQVISYARNGISKKDKPEECVQHYFSQIKTSADGLMALLNDMLDLSKMESGKIQYTFNDHNLWKLTETAIEEVQPLCDEKDIQLVFSITNESTLLFCDGDRIGQVVRKLLSNAIKYSPREKKIHIKLEKGESAIGRRVSDHDLSTVYVFSIKDRGIGIPENDLSLIFDKFVQGTKTTTGVGGNGLGLAICKEIIEAHKGKIWAENNEDGGASFSFALPVNPSKIDSSIQ